MKNLKVGDKVLYKDIGDKKNKVGRIKEVTTKNNEVTGYAVICEDGAILGCAENELIKLDE